MYLAQGKVLIKGVLHCEEFSIENLQDAERAFKNYLIEFKAVQVTCLELDISLATDEYYIETTPHQAPREFETNPVRI